MATKVWQATTKTATVEAAREICTKILMSQRDGEVLLLMVMVVVVWQVTRYLLQLFEPVRRAS